MKSYPSKAHLYRVEGGELAISGKALLELMTAVLDKGYDFRFRARGSSMAPFIHDGDIICVSPIQIKAPGMGEIVAYHQTPLDKLVVHRLIGRHVACYLMQGDNTSHGACEWVAEPDLLGRVTHIERNGKAVWMGLGLERYLIALSLRIGTILPLAVRIVQVTKGWLQRASR